VSGSRSILIVDDDAAFAESNKDLLEAYGYEVRTARDGREGIDLARRMRPDLMILDVMMTTDTEGFDVARSIREIPELKAMPILLVTGIVQAMNLPATPEPDDKWLPVERILEKPIDPSRLVKEVERVLNPGNGKGGRPRE
jgi:CheY-like chemotaxis protein